MIERKKKICKKGSGKAIGFTGCNSESWKLEYGLCTSCLYDWMTQTEPGKIEYQKRFNYLKAKNWKEEKSKMKESVKTLSYYENEAKKSFQKWVRFRDKGKPCISCANFSNLVDGGHYKKAEIYSGVIFHEMNCHLQCRKCNRYLGGNELNYRDGLIGRYGLDYVTFIEDLANSTRIKKYTKQELIDIKKKYDNKIKNNDFNN